MSKRASISVFLLVVCLCAAALPQAMIAQVLYGSVTGTITDQTSAVIPAVQVALTNDATGLKRQVATDAAGIFRILDLPQGTYTIEVTAAGFRPLKKTNVVVVIGQVNAQDLQLTVGTAGQEI